MSPPVVKRFRYHPDREYFPRSAARVHDCYKGGSVRFEPGEVAEITADQWETLQCDPIIWQLVEARALEEIKSPAVPPESLPNLNPEASHEAISTCVDVEILVEFAKYSPSTELQASVKQRSEALIEILSQIEQHFPPDTEPDLSQFSVEEAKLKIAACHDATLLKAWMLDPRSTIRNLVDRRLKELEVGV